jgi:hypothetical protein
VIHAFVGLRRSSQATFRYFHVYALSTVHNHPIPYLILDGENSAEYVSFFEVRRLMVQAGVLQMTAYNPITSDCCPLC